MVTIVCLVEIWEDGLIVGQMYKLTISHKQTNIMNNTKKDLLLGKNIIKKQDMDMKRGVVHIVVSGQEILNTIKFLTLKKLDIYY